VRETAGWSLQDLEILDQVVAEGSFSAAARRLGITRSAVSKAVRRLERALEVQLFSRTTHEVHLTAVGRRFHPRAQAVLDAAQTALHEVRRQRGEVAGRVRLSVPTGLGVAYVVRWLPELLARHPRLEIDLAITDQHVNLVAEGVDLVLRVVPAGSLPDSELRAVRLARGRMCLCAARAWVERHGVPRSVRDLVALPCIGFSAGLPDDPRTTWWFDEDGPVEIRVEGRLRSDHGLAVREAVIAGLGIGLLPDFMVADEIENGAVVHLLPGVGTRQLEIYAMRPASAFPSPAVVAVQQFLSDRLTARMLPP